MSEFVEQLAVREKDRLAALGTFVEIEDLTTEDLTTEDLTTEIGDEVARQLANCELLRRGDVLCEQPTHACPDCGKVCSVAPYREPIILQGMRGEIEYGEPRCHCSRCRRDFFPSGGRTEAVRS